MLYAELLLGETLMQYLFKAQNFPRLLGCVPLVFFFLPVSNPSQHAAGQPECLLITC